MKIRIFIASIILFVSWTFHAITQTLNSVPPTEDALRKVVREIFEEKLKLPRDQWEQLSPTFNRELDENTARFVAKSMEESAISADVQPESEIHAAVNPLDTSNIVVASIRFNQSNPSEILLCPIYYTRNFGQTWQKSTFRTVPTEQNARILGGGDPVLAFDAQGTLYCSWIDLYTINFSTVYMAMYWASSTDGGATWIRQTNDLIGKAQISNGVEAFDKEWLAVDRSQSPNRGTLFAAFFHPDKSGMKIEIRKKPPLSSSFEATSTRVSSTEFRFVQFASIGVDPSGNLHVSFFGTKDSVQYALYHALSTDGGASFQTETKISNVDAPRFSVDARYVRIAGIDSTRVYPCPHIVIDHSAGPTQGSIHATWTALGIDAKGNSGADVYYSRSTDNGTTWSAPRIINTDTPGPVRDQFYSSIAVNENGAVAITWYDRRDDAANTSARLYAAVSSDGGASFGNNVPVATQQMDFLKSGTRNNGFSIGEYTQVIMTAGWVIPFWADGRKNNGDLDVYAAFLPLQSISDVERVTSIREGFELLDIFPNPIITGSGSTSRAMIRYRIENPTNIWLTVHDIGGRELLRLFRGRQAPGMYETFLDLTDLPTGRYACSLVTDSGCISKSLTVLR